MAEKRQGLAVCLLIAIALVGTYLVMVDKSQLTRQSFASLNFSLTDESNKPINVSFFLYVDFLNFNNTVTTHLHGNFEDGIISDGSGIEVDCHGLTPSEYLSLKIDRLEILPSLHTVEDAFLRASFRSANSSDFNYSGLVSLLNNQGISVASEYYQTSGSNFVPPQKKTIALYLNMLIAALTAFFIGATAMIIWQRAKWFPIITVSILLVTLFLYVFVGSGYEIFAKAGNWGWLGWLPIPFSVLLHGYDWHIFGNLFYFTVLSVLLESFLIMRGQPRRKNIGWWYFLPLFSPIFFLPIWQGFGLSLSIEAMTWTLWAYIIRNHDKLVTNKTRTFLAILAGISSSTFLGWVVSYSFRSDGNPYDVSEAFGHIFFGVASCVGVFIIAFRSEIRQKLRSVMSRIGRNMKESSKKK